MLRKNGHPNTSCRFFLLLALLFLSSIAARMAMAQSPTQADTIRARRARPDISLGLTMEEKIYLGHKNKLTFVCDPNWPPFEFIDATDRYSGMGADYLKIIAERIGIPFQLIRTTSWSESLELARTGKCDIMPILNRTPERGVFLNFTTPYFVSQYILVGRGSFWFNNGLRDLEGKTMAVVRGYKMEEDIRRDHPGIKLITTETTSEALTMVNEGKAFATISTILEASHIIRTSKLSELRVIGHTELINEPRMGVRKNDPTLLSIMQKAVDSLTDAEKELISVKWISESTEIQSNRPSILQILSIALLCLAMAFFAFKKFK